MIAVETVDFFICSTKLREYLHAKIAKRKKQILFPLEETTGRNNTAS
jgi:hypothetical protein